jgi:hypothetical protein
VTGPCAYGVHMSVHEPVGGFGVAVVREDGKWRCSSLELATLNELDAAITALRKIRSTGALFGMLNVDDEFFVLLRPSPGGVSLLLSDAAAALDYDIAADVLDLLRVEPPDDEDDGLWPEVDEVDLYPDEQLQMIAQRCGFSAEFGALVDRVQQ